MKQDICNIADAALRRIKKYCGKKIKDITEKEKQKYKAFFKDKDGIFVIEKLTRNIIEHCKLPKAIELRKKLGYNHTDIMICEETSIAEKIIKLFPKENIVLNKKFNNRKPDIWFKNYNIIIENDEGNHESYDLDDEKEREDMFKNEFNLFQFFGEITLYISNLREENAVNGMIIMLNITKLQIKKILNLKLVAMLESQNIKTFLLKDIFQIG